MRALPRLLALAPVLLGCAAHATSVSPADLARCAGIAESDTRLSCYDALAHRVAGVATPAPPVAAPVMTPAGTPPPAVKAAPPPPAAAPAAPPASAVALDDPKNFGLNLNQLQRGQTPAQTPNAGVKSITARITSAGGGAGRLRIVLDNDQTWDVLDDDGRITTGLEVTIRKASLGSFLMSAAHRKYRVHRIS